MTDMNARARELAEIRAMSNEDLASKFRTEPGDKWFDYREELLKRLAAQSAAPVEEVAREILAMEADCRCGNVEPENVVEILRQHGYGAPVDWHSLKPLATKICEEVRAFPSPINIELAAKAIANSSYGAQGQGVEPRCPKCGKPRPCLMRINATKTEYVGLVRCYACGSDINLNNIEDFAQFFPPVPSPESATKVISTAKVVEVEKNWTGKKLLDESHFDKP